MVEDTNIILAQLRAGQIANDRTEILVDQICQRSETVERRIDEVRQALLNDVEREASEVVTLEQIRGAVCASCEVGDVDADK